MPSPLTKLRHRLCWQLYSPSHRWTQFRTRGRPFTIVSNNCWGAEIYTELKLPYSTPFVGLFVLPPCYLKLLSDLRGYLKQPLRFVGESGYGEVESARRQRNWIYPIALLGDVEIHFLHYKSEAEAADKWARRLARIHWDHLFFKFCDYQLPTTAELQAFDRLDLPRKVLFTAQPQPSLKCAISPPTLWAPPTAALHLPDGLTLYRVCKGFFNVGDWLRGDTGRPGLLQSTLTKGWLNEFYPRADSAPATPSHGLDQLCQRRLTQT